MVMANDKRFNTNPTQFLLSSQNSTQQLKMKLFFQLQQKNLYLYVKSTQSKANSFSWVLFFLFNFFLLFRVSFKRNSRKNQDCIEENKIKVYLATVQ